MFGQSLIESKRARGTRGGVTSTLVSVALHALVALAVVVGGLATHEAAQADEPIEAYLVNSPPPPPPPPPPPASSTSQPTPRVETQRDPEPVDQSFVVPEEIPEEVPDVETDDSAAEDPAGVVGGIEGGVEGGVIGGILGGVIGGELDGQLGGVLGGTGSGPYRPGPEVTAPVSIYKVDPPYTEDARKARVQGIVILEAVVDERGNVTRVEVLKPLAAGLDQNAVEAIRQWKYEPGRKDGVPVPVLITVSVSFRLQ